jgi:ketosteroid isomerase-like protein
LPFMGRRHSMPGKSMMRARVHSGTYTLMLGLLTCGALCLGAHADGRRNHKEKPKQRIFDLEQEWREATLTGDSSELDHLLSDDYVGISWMGQVSTKPMMLDRMRNRTLVITHLDLDDVKIKVVDKVAIVTGIANVDGMNDGTAMHGDFRYTRIYQRQAVGGWKVTNFEATRAPQVRIRTASTTSLPGQQ